MEKIVELSKKFQKKNLNLSLRSLIGSSNKLTGDGAHVGN